MKNSTYSLAIFGVICLAFFTGCKDPSPVFHGTIGSGNVLMLERALEGFNSIRAKGMIGVNIIPGKNFRVIVITDCNLQDGVLTTVNDDTLYINDMLGSFSATALMVNVYMPELVDITASGMGSIQITNGNAPELNLSLSGMRSIDAQNFQVQNVTINFSGMGTVAPL